MLKYNSKKSKIQKETSNNRIRKEEKNEGKIFSPSASKVRLSSMDNFPCRWVLKKEKRDKRKKKKMRATFTWREKHEQEKR